MRLSIFLFFLLIANASADERNILMNSPDRNIGDGAYELSTSVNFFKQLGRFDVNGEEETLTVSDSFSKMDGDLDFRYGLSRLFEIGAGFRLRQNISTTANFDNANTGFESLYGSVRFTMVPEANKNLNYTLEFKLRHSVYTNESFAAGSAPEDTLVLGDGGDELTLGIHFSYDYSINSYIYLYGAYNRPGNDLSPEFNYQAELFYPYTNWGFGVGIAGVYSLGGDAFTAVPNEKPSQATGATNLFNSINRSYFKPYLKFERAFTKWKLSFSAGQVPLGISTDSGMEYSFGITYRKSGKSTADKKISKFKEYIIEASVIKSSPRESFVKVDKGIAHDLEKGMKVDIFKSDYFGGNILVASGYVFQSGADWSIIKITTKYRNMRVLPGFVVRAY